MSIELTIEVLSLGYRFINLVLELEVLLLQDLNLAIGRGQLDLSVLQGQDLIFKFGPSLEQLRVSVGVVLLLIFISLDPQITRLLLIVYHFLQTLDAIVELSLGHLGRLGKASKLSFKRRHLVGHLVKALVQVLDF